MLDLLRGAFAWMRTLTPSEVLPPRPPVRDGLDRAFTVREDEQRRARVATIIRIRF